MEEFITAREEVRRSIAELEAQGVPCNRSPRLGVMVELPAAIEIAADLARESDFLSIGTNDLVMYMLAADRTNHRVSDLYRSIHPAVVRAVGRLMDNVRSTGVPVSVCGASAADPAMAVFYLGLGIRTLSVDPEGLPAIAGVVAEVDLTWARETTSRMRAAVSRHDLAAIAEEIRGRFS